MLSNQATRAIHDATRRDTTAERLRHDSAPFVTTHCSINLPLFLRIFVFITLFYLAVLKRGQETALKMIGRRRSQLFMAGGRSLVSETT